MTRVVGSEVGDVVWEGGDWPLGCKQLVQIPVGGEGGEG